MERFLELIRVTFFFPISWLPFVLLLFAPWVGALIYSCKRPENKDCHFLRGCFAAFITPFGLLLFASVFGNSGEDSSANLVPLASLLFHIAINILFARLWPYAFLAIFASFALSGLMLLGAVFISLCAISGAWL